MKTRIGVVLLFIAASVLARFAIKPKPIKPIPDGRYVIVWKSYHTGYCGQGTADFDYVTALTIAVAQNEKWDGLLHDVKRVEPNH